MSDESHVEAIELEHKPGSVDQKSEAPGKFPFSAFEFTEPSVADPLITLLAAWVMKFGPLRLGSRSVTVSTSAASGTPVDGDLWLQRET